MSLDPSRQRIIPWLAPVAGLLVFLPTLWYGFVWDDQFTIVQNTAELSSWDSLRKVWLGPYDITVSMFRPILSTLIVLQFHLFHLNPFGYHLTSVALHVIACALVYRLARRLSPSDFVAICASLLFAVHAVHIEAIAWVSGFAEPLADIIILAGLLSYIRYRKEGHDAKWLLLACVWLFSGLLVKENVITLPFLILAYEFTLAEPATRTNRRLITSFLALSATVLVYAAIRLHIFTQAAPAEVHLPLPTLLMTLPSVLVFYLKKLALPLPVSPYYEQDYVSAASGAFWLPVAVLVLVIVIAWIWARRSTNPGLVRFAFWGMAIGILPVLDLNLFLWKEIAHDRFVYLSSVFFCLLISQLLFEDLQLGDAEKSRAPRIALLLAAVLVLFSAVALLTQLPPWQNNLAFYYYGHRMAPRNPHPFWGLAEVYLLQGDLPHAEQVLTDLVVQFPAPKAFEQLADIRMRMGQPAAAEEPLRRAIQAAPDRLNLHGELAECLQAQGKAEEALLEARKEAALREAQSHSARNPAALP
jgi:hypothetical protein